VLRIDPYLEEFWASGLEDTVIILQADQVVIHNADHCTFIIVAKQIQIFDTFNSNLYVSSENKIQTQGCSNMGYGEIRPELMETYNNMVQKNDTTELLNFEWAHQECVEGIIDDYQVDPNTGVLALTNTIQNWAYLGHEV
jgi:hypothetical protein